MKLYTEDEVRKFTKAIYDALENGKLSICRELPYYMTPIEVELTGEIKKGEKSITK